MIVAIAIFGLILIHPHLIYVVLLLQRDQLLRKLRQAALRIVLHRAKKARVAALGGFSSCRLLFKLLLCELCGRRRHLVRLIQRLCLVRLCGGALQFVAG